MSITEAQLDQIHERIDALGGRATDDYDRGANDAIRDALRIIEEAGGMDPQDRAGDGLGAVVCHPVSRSALAELASLRGEVERMTVERTAWEAVAIRNMDRAEAAEAKVCEPTRLRELSDRNEILENKLRVQTIRRERAEVQRDALSARLTRDGVPDYVTVTANGG